MFSQRLGSGGGEEQCGDPPPQFHASLGIRGSGTPCRAQTILTWKCAMSMAAPEVPPHSKQAIGALLGTGPGWNGGARGASSYNTAGALVR